MAKKKQFNDYSAPVTTGPVDDYDARTRRFDPERAARIEAERERDASGRFVSTEKKESKSRGVRRLLSRRKSKSK